MLPVHGNRYLLFRKYMGNTLKSAENGSAETFFRKQLLNNYQYV